MLEKPGQAGKSLYSSVEMMVVLTTGFGVSAGMIYHYYMSLQSIRGMFFSAVLGIQGRYGTQPRRAQVVGYAYFMPTTLHLSIFTPFPTWVCGVIQRTHRGSSNIRTNMDSKKECRSKALWPAFGGQEKKSKAYMRIRHA